MNNISFFIDGFNLYHALEEKTEYHRYKWLNLKKLSECFISPKDAISEIYYFTAYAKWNPGKVARHKKYVDVLKLEGVQPIFGAFRLKDVTCRICKKEYKTHEEKQTDVNIAIKLFETAIDNTWDTAMIISGDSDLIPSINAVKRAFPAKQICIIVPIGQRAEELKNNADFSKKIKQKHLRTSQFDDEIRIDESLVYRRPDTWA